MTASWPANLRDGWNDVGSRPWAQDKTHHLSGAVGSPEQPMGIGVGCILVSALLIAVGANLIRRAAGKERLHRLPHRQRVYLCQPLWLLGLVLLSLNLTHLVETAVTWACFWWEKPAVRRMVVGNLSNTSTLCCPRPLRSTVDKCHLPGPFFSSTHAMLAVRDRS